MPSNNCIRDGKYGKIPSPKKDKGRLVGQVQGVGRGWMWDVGDGVPPPPPTHTHTQFLILFEVKRALT